MRRLRTVLLIDAASDLAEAFLALSLPDPRTRVVARAAAEARELAERDPPFLVVADLPADAAAAAEIARWIAGLSGEGMRVAVVPERAAEARAACWEAGLEDVVERPVADALWKARLKAAHRLADRDEALALMSADVALLRGQIDRQSDQVPALLAALLDLGFPGAVDRGLRTVELTQTLAVRFGVPDTLRRELEQAARLHELGRLVGRAGGADQEGWQYTRTTVAILERIDGFEGATEVIASLYENWDGTGQPERWQAGQIPLRSRILRVVVELFRALERGATTAGAIQELEEHAGTAYDPMVVVHLKAHLEARDAGDPRGSSVLVPIGGLEPGMELAEDLYTDSGLKLLARGTQLTPSSLEILRRRHRAEPILHGAAVRRQAA